MPIIRSDDSELQSLLAGQTQILADLQILRNQPSGGDLTPVLNAIADLRAIQIETLQAVWGLYSINATAYTLTQSNVQAGVTPGSFANLNDGNGNTGTATNSNASQWIKATFATAQSIRGVRVAGGILAGFGQISPSLNGKLLQYSLNDIDWITVATISGVEDSGTNQFRLIPLPQPVSARFWRIFNPPTISGWTATSEFRFSS